MVSSSITCSFPQLSSCPGYVTHALLALSPLYSFSEKNFRVRLACFSHAASVCSEPGSNSSIKYRSTPPKRGQDRMFDSVGRVFLWGARPLVFPCPPGPKTRETRKSCSLKIRLELYKNFIFLIGLSRGF